MDPGHHGVSGLSRFKQPRQIIIAQINITLRQDSKQPVQRSSGIHHFCSEVIYWNVGVRDSERNNKHGPRSNSGPPLRRAKTKLSWLWRLKVSTSNKGTIHSRQAVCHRYKFHGGYCLPALICDQCRHVHISVPPPARPQHRPRYLRQRSLTIANDTDSMPWPEISWRERCPYDTVASKAHRRHPALEVLGHQRG